jgi:cytochrome c biogenesis protein CcmG/thiol:disulfide interchange protein DsbE
MRVGRRPFLHIASAIVAAVTLTAACGGSSPATYEAVDMVTGEAVSVEQLEGAPALLVSWATWCRECDEELAGLQEFASSPLADGVTIVAVNLDAADVDDEIAAKIERHGLTVELWRDRRNDFRRAFGALGVPTTVVLDADGAVTGTFPGAVDFADADVLAALEQASRT